MYHLNSFLLYNLSRVHIQCICWSFCRPDVWFNVKVLKSLQIMEVPLLKSWIQANIDDGITKGLYLSVNSRKVFDIREHLSNILFIYLLKSYCVALVDPGKIDIPIVRYAGPLKQRVASKSKQNKLGESIYYMILQYLFLQQISPYFQWVHKKHV